MFVVGFLLALEPLSTEVLTRTHEVVMMYFSISYLRQRALLICNGYLIHSLPIQPVVLETRGRGGGKFCSTSRRVLSIFLFLLLPLQLLGSMILKAALGWHTLISKYADLCLSRPDPLACVSRRACIRDLICTIFQSSQVAGWNPCSTSTSWHTMFRSPLRGLVTRYASV